jgi:AraC-like DNA-binding protein
MARLVFRAASRRVPSEDRVVSVGISLVRALVDAIERAGVDVSEYLAAAGVTEDLLQDADARIELPVYDRLQELAVEMSGDPALGLHMGEHASLGAFHLVGHIAAQCRTIREVIDVFFRFYRIVTDVPPPQLVDEGDRVRIVYQYQKTKPVCNRLRSEFIMTRFLVIGRMFAGPNESPEEVWFEHSAPSYVAEYRRIFEGRARFDKPSTGMVLARELLDREQRYADPRLYAVLRDKAEEALRRLDRGATLGERIKDLVLCRVLEAKPSLGDAAREVGMTPRALRRRLEAEGTSFAAVVDEARAELARRILGESTTTIQEAAYRLGFAEVSSFHRAFRRWTGMTPAAYRASLE